MSNSKDNLLSSKGGSLTLLSKALQQDIQITNARERNTECSHFYIPLHQCRLLTFSILGHKSFFIAQCLFPMSSMSSLTIVGQPLLDLFSIFTLHISSLKPQDLNVHFLFSHSTLKHIHCFTACKHISHSMFYSINGYFLILLFYS